MPIGQLLISTLSFSLGLYFTMIYLVELISDIIMKGSKASGYAIYSKMAILAWTIFYGVTHI